MKFQQSRQSRSTVRFGPATRKLWEEAEAINRDMRALKARADALDEKLLLHLHSFEEASK